MLHNLLEGYAKSSLLYTVTIFFFKTNLLITWAFVVSLAALCCTLILSCSSFIAHFLITESVWCHKYYIYTYLLSALDSGERNRTVVALLFLNKVKIVSVANNHSVLGFMFNAVERIDIWHRFFFIAKFASKAVISTL